METAFSEAYKAPTDDRALAPVLQERQAYALIERARPIGPSTRVLDLGSGAGVLGRILRQRLGRAAPFTTIGASADLFAARYIRRPGFASCQVNLLGLPFENGAFDLVFCQETLQYAPDAAAALNEMRRVLAPRGRLVLSTARSRREQPLHDALGMVIERRLGPPTDKRFSLGDPEILYQLMSEAGFCEIRIEIVMISESFRSFPVQVNGLGNDLESWSLLDLERQKRLAALEENSGHAIESFATSGGYVASSSANVVTARAR
jgi:ubiquinone/menaquinone biosynthesis C-methylase UbiE